MALRDSLREQLAELVGDESYQAPAADVYAYAPVSQQAYLYN